MTLQGYSVSAKLGKVATGENDYVFTPRQPLAGKRGVVLCHGAGRTASEWVDPTNDPSSLALAAAITRAGLYCVASDLGLGTWGNATAVSRVVSAAAYLATLGVASDKILLVGVSMGNLTGVQYAIANPTKVAGIVGLIPASSLTDIYTNDRGSNRTGIQIAWSTTYPAALPAGADPSAGTNSAPAAGIPYQAYYSTADTVVLPSTVTTLATQLGGTATVVSSTLDHSDAAVGAASVPAIVAFLLANA